MTTQEFLSDHPELTEEQIIRSESALGEAYITPSSSCPSLTYSHDEGSLSVWTATEYVDVRVDSITPEGSWNGSTWVSMKPGDIIKFRMSNTGNNYDGWSC
jgi:hypothetical protein